MTSNTEPTIKAATIAANISALTKILKKLAERSAEAHGYALIGDSNAGHGRATRPVVPLERSASPVRSGPGAPPRPATLVSVLWNRPYISAVAAIRGQQIRTRSSERAPRIRAGVDALSNEIRAARERIQPVRVTILVVPGRSASD